MRWWLTGISIWWRTLLALVENKAACRAAPATHGDGQCRARLDCRKPRAAGTRPAVADRRRYQDWWLALVAVAFGRFVALPEVTIKLSSSRRKCYERPALGDARQTIGAACRAAPAAMRARLDGVLSRQAGRQADAFVQRYEGVMEEADLAALAAQRHTKCVCSLLSGSGLYAMVFGSTRRKKHSPAHIRLNINMT